MFLAYYNFVWRTHDCRKRAGPGFRPRWLRAWSDRLMSFEDLFDAVMGEGYAMAA